jgi:hypothetical protein
MQGSDCGVSGRSRCHRCQCSQTVVKGTGREGEKSTAGGEIRYGAMFARGAGVESERCEDHRVGQRIRER